MIKEISMPMMAPVGGSSSSESELTWDDIPSAGPADIQSGRNVYIELNEDKTCTKASAGKILQFIKEGFMPVIKSVIPVSNGTYRTLWDWLSFTTSESTSGIVTYVLSPGSNLVLFAYSDALDKPFTTVERNSGSGSGDTAHA